eukprot:TRINITY_DN51401_c0_g1_i1.p1 TRINITY_DN51401_c0_g1~~TRINITY_DN51401_c0_g1_i1.p1  ORF type:complete len:281 (-),score=49.16 TRINITY_DN51401_c0_g1_i1:121-963(-)
MPGLPDNGALRAQVEFYFSQSNLRRDDFLRDLIAQDKHGWVELEAIAKFNRIRQLSNQADPKSCAERLTTALADSVTLEVSSKPTPRVRTVAALPIQSPAQEVRARTVVVLGIGLRATPALVAQFLEAYGEPVGYISIPQGASHAFAEYSTTDAAYRVTVLNAAQTTAGSVGSVRVLMLEPWEALQRARASKLPPPMMGMIHVPSGAPTPLLPSPSSASTPPESASAQLECTTTAKKPPPAPEASDQSDDSKPVENPSGASSDSPTVSYTHLTLPTKRIV